jgi:hypothetical protein
MWRLCHAHTLTPPKSSGPKDTTMKEAKARAAVRASIPKAPTGIQGLDDI